MNKFHPILGGLKDDTEIIVHLTGGTELRGQMTKLDRDGLLEMSTIGASADIRTFVDLESVMAVIVKRDLSDAALLEALHIDRSK